MDNSWIMIPLVIALVLIWAGGYGFGHEAGMKDVSSGKWSCELIEDTDKTTEWKCEEK